MFKIETHAHTVQVSHCANVPTERMIPDIKNAGYDAVIITDHFRVDTFAPIGENSNERADFFLSGYRAAKEAGERAGLKVFPGLELCFEGAREDFLVYGPEEKDFYILPELWHIGLEEAYRYIDSKGWLILQAHPFRSYLTRSNPAFLHGIEGYNGNKRHDSHNDEAKAYAKEHGLIVTSGSDYHEEEDLARGGMLFSRELGSVSEFVAALKNGEGELIETV